MAALARRLEGCSINTSKQSIIIATLFPNESLKQSGIVHLNPHGLAMLSVVANGQNTLWTVEQQPE